MQILLDTHTFLWFINGNSLLPKNMRSVIASNKNECFLSIASLWEVAIKLSISKLELHIGFEELESVLSTDDINLLPITLEDLEILQTLEHHHRDPFDRMIIAQAIANGLTIITKDEHFAKYDTDVVWS